MQISHLLLIGNGEEVSPRLLKTLAKEADYILAADAGADKALRAAVVPQGVIGDLDSISARSKKILAGHVIHVSSQDNTDLEKALIWAVQQHITQVTLVGFVGDRWDFSIGNLLALAKWARQLNITVAGNNWRIFPLLKSAKFTGKPGKRVSIIPLTTCTGVTLSGLVYPLKKARLTPGTTRTLSNKTKGTQFAVSFSRGSMLVYQEI